jgi:hypothetical protein
MYETARKSMYSAMEQEADPPKARQGYKEAVDGFDQFLTAAAKNRGMYRELVGSPRQHIAHPRFYLRLLWL